MVERQDIAIVGMACLFPGADNVDGFWRNLLDGRDTISRSAPLDAGLDGTFVRAIGKLSGVELFDADYFKIPPGEASMIDPQQRLLLEVAVTAMEDAGYGDDESPDRAEPAIGVFVGGGENEYLHEFVAPASGRNPYNDLRLRTGNGKDFLAARLAFKLGLTGPSITVQAGCATGLVAVATACNALIAGDCDMALAGSVSLVMPDVDGYEHEPGGILSADGHCRPFDVLASGTVPSSGVGLVVLKRDEDAVRDMDSRRAVLKGWAVNNDGGSRSGFTVPNITGQARVIHRALERAGVMPADVGHLETHGTATAVGDAVEIEALKQVFRSDVVNPRPCMLGAAKANIGHTDSAAGVAGLIKSVLIVERGLIPPLANFTELHDSLDLLDTSFAVPTKAVPWPRSGRRIAGVSSFGLGGNNAHVVISDAPEAQGEDPAPTAQVIALSARTPAQLEQLLARTARWFRNQAPMSSAAFADAAFTLAVGRRRFGCRWAAAVNDAELAATALATAAAPARQTARYELMVVGSAAELSALGCGELAAQPTFQAASLRLRRGIGRTPVPPAEAERAALTVLAILGCFDDLGLTFARIDGPEWIQPVLAWHSSGGDRAPSLVEAVQATAVSWAKVESTHAGTWSTRPAAAASPGSVVVDGRFSLLDSVATAWVAGAPVRLGRLYRDQRRRRRSLPTYPFERREHWIARSTRTTVQGSSVDRDSGDGAPDVSGLVAKVWRDVLGLDQIDADAHFVDDLGGDSMYAVEIGGQLNDKLGLDLPIDLPFVAPTINDAVAAVEAALSIQRTDS